MRRLFLLLLLAGISFSLVAVNSLDGRDVVSGIYYSAVTGEGVVFVTPTYDEATVYGKIGTGRDVLLIQSEGSPIIIGMENDLGNNGNAVEKLVSEDPYETNLELARRSGAHSFVLVDPVYGYNTVSALAYAKLNSMYLIFVDISNAEQVVSFLEDKNPQKLLLYGYVDGEVKDALDGSGLAYDEINNGDKFDDNLELARMYFSQNPSKSQVIFSDGNGFEDTLAAGDDPAILVSPIVPSATYDFMKEYAASGQIKVVMVVDQDYAQAAYNLKTSINKELGTDALHAFVKIGESAGTALKQVPMFPLPGPALGLEITSAEYNTVSGELEITYENTGNAPEYVESQVMVFVDGTYSGTVGEEEPFAMGRGAKVGRGYPIRIESGDILANVTAMFGSSRKYMENGIVRIMDAGRVEFTDTSALEIAGFTEDGMGLYVTYTNNGSGTVYFRPDATTEIEGRSTKIEDENTYELGAGEGKMVKFPGIAKVGSTVVAGADYGAREAFLDNRVEEEYLVQATPVQAGFEFDPMYLLVLLLLIAVIYLVWDRNRRKK